MGFRKYHTPNQFPSAVTFRRDNLEFDFVIDSSGAFEAFKMNVANLDGPALKGLVAQRDVRVAPITVNDLRSVLVNGAEWRERRRFEPDGGAEVCGSCRNPFQPVLIPWRSQTTGREGISGNFTVRKAENVAKFDAWLNGIADDLTSRIFGEVRKQTMPDGLLARALGVCKDCREKLERNGYRNRYYSREGVVDELLAADGKIATAMNRNAFAESLGGRRRDYNNRHDSRSDDYRRGEYRSDRPRPERTREAFGVLFHKETDDKLVELKRQGTVTSLEQLRDAPVAQVVQWGLAESESQAEGIRHAAASGLRYLERQAQQEQAVRNASTAIFAERVVQKDNQRRDDHDRRDERRREDKRSRRDRVRYPQYAAGRERDE